MPRCETQNRWDQGKNLDKCRTGAETAIRAPEPAETQGSVTAASLLCGRGAFVSRGQFFVDGNQARPLLAETPAELARMGADLRGVALHAEIGIDDVVHQPVMQEIRPFGATPLAFSSSRTSDNCRMRSLCACRWAS